MSDSLTQLELAIADRLQPLKDYGLDILNSPHRCAGRAKAIALFYFTDQTGEPPNSCSQNRDITLKVQVEACDQRTHKVAYPFITAIDLLLDRFEPGVGKSGRIKFTSVRYVPYEDKNGFKWIYDMTFNLQTIKCKVTDLDRAIAECFEVIGNRYADT